ncbi:hypothetical protein EJB05_35925, partial [Eragrostis curvula]
MACHIGGFIATTAYTHVLRDSPTDAEEAVINAAINAKTNMVAQASPGTKISTFLQAFRSATYILEVRCYELKQFDTNGGNSNNEENFKANKIEELNDEHTSIYRLDVNDIDHLKGELLTHYYKIRANFRDLPFTARDLEKLRINLLDLKQAKMLKSYPVQYVKPGSLVAHIKATVFMKNDKLRSMTPHHRVGAKRNKMPGLPELSYCGKLPIGEESSSDIPKILDVSWNIHGQANEFYGANTLACVGSFGAYLFHQAGPHKDRKRVKVNLDEGWTKKILWEDPYVVLCDWCPVEGRILAIGRIDAVNKGEVVLLDCTKPAYEPVVALQ